MGVSEGGFRVTFWGVFWGSEGVGSVLPTGGFLGGGWKGSEGVAVGVVSEGSFRPLAPQGWKVVSDCVNLGGVSEVPFRLRKGWGCVSVSEGGFRLVAPLGWG